MRPFPLVTAFCMCALILSLYVVQLVHPVDFASTSRSQAVPSTAQSEPIVRSTARVVAGPCVSIPELA